MAGCEICATLALDMPRIFESNHWRISLSPNQGYLGRAVVVLNRHAASISDLTVEEWRELHEVMRRYESAVKAAFGARMFNWTCLMNNAFKSSDPQPHVHWHAWPRYDREVTVAGQTFNDPNFAHHYDKKHAKPVDDIMRERIGLVIKEHL